MKTYKIASIPGDGIGVEVVDAGLRALHALAERAGTFQFDVTHFDWGTDRYKREGALMPADGAQDLIGFDAILFGAVGAPDVPDHLTLWGLRLNICQPLDQYANVRPTRILPGIKSPLAGVTDKDLDWVIVRENSEGEYSGQGDVATVVNRKKSLQIWRSLPALALNGLFGFAFELAQSRPRKLLTIVTKSNAQRHGMVLWDDVAREVARDFPDVTWDKMLVDAMTVRMVMQPQSLDTNCCDQPAC